jgi:hypothetical protein
MYTVRPSGSRAAAHPRPPREQTTSGRPFPANPRRYNITKRVEQVFSHKSGLSLRGAAQQTANGTTHRRHAIPRRHNVTKRVEQAFSRINQHRLCSDKSARHNLPLTVHPPGDTQPHERNQTTSPNGSINKDSPHQPGAHRRAPPTLYGVTSTIKQAFPAKSAQVQHHKTRQTGLSKNKATQIV